MKKSLILLLAVLLTFGLVAGGSAADTLQVISCPEQEFSTRASADYAWNYTARDGITIYTEHENSIPYVLIFRSEDWIVESAEYIHEQLTPYYQEQYGDDLVSSTEYYHYEIAGREMPAALYTYKLQGYLIELLRAFDVVDGHTVVYTAKYIQGQGEETLKALETAVENYQPDANYYAGAVQETDRWAYKIGQTASGDIQLTFDEVILTIPGSWDGKVDLKVNERSVSFYQTASRKLMNQQYGVEGGLLFSLGYSETTDYQNMPSYKDIGKGKDGWYYLIYPTDYQAYAEDTAARAEYDRMWGQVKDSVTASIR